jgi:hypothetical protein
LQRAVITAILTIPLLVIVVLSVPAWLSWPFLSGDRRTAVLQFVERLIDWVTAVAGIS